MSIKFDCPQCGKKYAVPEQVAGKTAQCKACGHRMVVPLVTLTDGDEVLLDASELEEVTPGDGDDGLEQLEPLPEEPYAAYEPPAAAQDNLGQLAQAARQARVKRGSGQTKVLAGVGGTVLSVVLVIGWIGLKVWRASERINRRNDSSYVSPPSRPSASPVRTPPPQAPRGAAWTHVTLQQLVAGGGQSGGYLAITDFDLLSDSMVIEGTNIRADSEQWDRAWIPLFVPTDEQPQRSRSRLSMAKYEKPSAVLRSSHIRNEDDMLRYLREGVIGVRVVGNRLDREVALRLAGVQASLLMKDAVADVMVLEHVPLPNTFELADVTAASNTPAPRRPPAPATNAPAPSSRINTAAPRPQVAVAPRKDPDPATLATWMADAALLTQLAPAVPIGPYTIRPPAGFTYSQRNGHHQWRDSTGRCELDVFVAFLPNPDNAPAFPPVLTGAPDDPPPSNVYIPRAELSYGKVNGVHFIRAAATTGPSVAPRLTRFFGSHDRNTQVLMWVRGTPDEPDKVALAEAAVLTFAPDASARLAWDKLTTPPNTIEQPDLTALPVWQPDEASLSQLREPVVVAGFAVRLPREMDVTIGPRAVSGRGRGRLRLASFTLSVSERGSARDAFPAEQSFAPPDVLRQDTRRAEKGHVNGIAMLRVWEERSVAGRRDYSARYGAFKGRKLIVVSATAKSQESDQVIRLLQSAVYTVREATPQEIAAAASQPNVLPAEGEPGVASATPAGAAPPAPAAEPEAPDASWRPHLDDEAELADAETFEGYTLRAPKDMEYRGNGWWSGKVGEGTTGLRIALHRRTPAQRNDDEPPTPPGDPDTIESGRLDGLAFARGRRTLRNGERMQLWYHGVDGEHTIVISAWSDDLEYTRRLDSAILTFARVGSTPLARPQPRSFEEHARDFERRRQEILERQRKMREDAERRHRELLERRNR